MLKNNTSVLQHYFNEAVALNILQSNIYYFNFANVHHFIIVNDNINEEIEEKINSLSRDSFDKHYDIENEQSFLNFVLMSKEDIEKSNYPLALDILENMEKTEYTPIPKNKASTIQEKHI